MNKAKAEELARRIRNEAPGTEVRIEYEAMEYYLIVQRPRFVVRSSEQWEERKKLIQSDE